MGRHYAVDAHMILGDSATASIGVVALFNSDFAPQGLCVTIDPRLVGRDNEAVAVRSLQLVPQRESLAVVRVKEQEETSSGR